MASKFMTNLYSSLRQASTSTRTVQRRTYAQAQNTIPPTGPISNTQPQSRMAGFWHSPVGPKTVHFWAPVMKWGLVIAGAADFARPAESLSMSQNAALMATGLIWTRWCFIIKPRNLFLASVNFLLFCVGATQVTRITLYNRSKITNDSMVDGLEKAASKEAKVAQTIVDDPAKALDRARKEL